MTLPAAINCPAQGNAHVAIGVSAVPASDVGVSGTASSTLLTTSCRNNAQGNVIYFIDPGSSDQTLTTVAGTIVHQLTVDFTPDNGWGAMAFRGGEQLVLDLFAGQAASATFSP